jgi:ribonuclease T1
MVKRFFAMRLAGAHSLLVTLGLAGALGLAVMPMAHAKGPSGPVLADTITGATISQADLPKQGRETYDKIFKGGPFEYDKDGVVFGNRERILPAQKRGYYREYTVKTPYARNRGAKRIVCGGSQPTTPEACYYSDDHYASFKRIVN